MPCGEARCAPFFLLSVSQSLPLDCDTVLFFSVPASSEETTHRRRRKVRSAPASEETSYPLPPPAGRSSLHSVLPPPRIAIAFAGLRYGFFFLFPPKLHSQLAPPPRQAQWSRSTLRIGKAAGASGLRRVGVKGEGRLCKKPLPLACLFPSFLHGQKRGPSGAAYQSPPSPLRGSEGYAVYADAVFPPLSAQSEKGPSGAAYRSSPSPLQGSGGYAVYADAGGKVCALGDGASAPPPVSGGGAQIPSPEETPPGCKAVFHPFPPFQPRRGGMAPRALTHAQNFPYDMPHSRAIRLISSRLFPRIPSPFCSRTAGL